MLMLDSGVVVVSAVSMTRGIVATCVGGTRKSVGTV